MSGPGSLAAPKRGGRESNQRPIDRKSSALTNTYLIHIRLLYVQKKLLSLTYLRHRATLDGRNTQNPVIIYYFSFAFC